MRKIAASILFLLLGGCSGPHGVGWEQGSFQEALTLAKTQDKPVLVDFFSPT